MLGDKAEAGTLESCFPRSQARNRGASGASVTVLDLEGAAGGAQMQPLPLSLGHTSSIDS